MARFCGKCGAPIEGTSAFCTACGAPTTQPAQAAPPYQEVAPQPAPYTPPAQSYPPPTRVVQPAPTAKSGSALKIILVVLVVLALGALGVIGGLLYFGHKVVTKIENKAAEAGLSTSALGKSPNTFAGDPCRFLTTTEVSKAIGVPIIRTKSDGDSCSYMAHGTAASMTAKHASAITGQRGADKATQEKFQQFAEGIFAQQQKNAEAADPNAAVETTVLSISFDEGSAEAQMKLNSKVLGALGSASGSSQIAGIGDEAFVAADGMMLVRKGDTLVRIMYISCPCSTVQIEPLAKKLAAAL